MKLEKYKEAVKKHQKKEPYLKSSLLAFLGGGICGLIAQGLIDLYHQVCGFNLTEAMALMSVSIVFITSLLTLFGIYKHIGKLFGAGLFLPTTGFANSLTSSAIEGRFEGFISGVGSQIFTLAGSVIIYGVSSSVILLIIAQVLMFFGVSL